MKKTKEDEEPSTMLGSWEKRSGEKRWGYRTGLRTSKKREKKVKK